ncbi:MAG: arsenosugar biosynthesis radical SAM protein ArsS [Desulfobacterales bacterium]|jgi:radical SAM/Cys-rich protein|nr:arsenosugar biosynthesis radical SAM protein ArsS [Desulfobacterales bacterium]
MPFQETISKPKQALEEKAAEIVPFKSTLAKHDLKLVRNPTHTLQINLGFLCNQTCQHCHLNAGPARKENMGSDTVNEVVAYAQRCHFDTIDITGGAPELNPHLLDLIKKISPLAPRIMLRSNLSALKDQMNRLIEPLKSHRVVIVASFPSLNLNQTDSQRGEGIFAESIAVLKELNAMGYGRNGSGLELNLVSNPTGAFLPPNQEKTEKRYHQILDQKWGVRFNRLFSFANVPLGRFRQWLIKSGNFESYMQKLVSNFNPCSVEGLMCRTLVSVSWDGYLYDCDFNLARGVYMSGKKNHVSEMPGPPEPDTPIVTADHCYTCAAGLGFT